MKKKLMKSTLAVALVAAAAFGGAKTYSNYNTASESSLLSENIEALSEENSEQKTYNNIHIQNYTYYLDGSKKLNGCTSSCWEQESPKKTCHSHGLKNCCSN